MVRYFVAAVIKSVSEILDGILCFIARQNISTSLGLSTSRFNYTAPEPIYYFDANMRYGGLVTFFTSCDCMFIYEEVKSVIIFH